MRQAYRVVAVLIMLMVLWQAGAVAGGWFEVISDVDAGKAFASEDDANLGHDLHSIGAMIIPLLSLILVGLSFGARFDGAKKLAAFVLLAVVLQWVLAILAFETSAVIGALHGINAFVIFGLALMCVRRAQEAGRGSLTGATSTV